VGFVINEAERLRKSSTNLKTKFLPEYSFNCCKNLKRCRNYPASICVEIMQKIHGLTPFWWYNFLVIMPHDTTRTEEKMNINDWQALNTK